ncbi:MAG: GNAT family N-acetyltransferase [Acidobacteria bacterium]|nr:GNAT family N-acetyltransferase [Acidobacteriota bacterium]
MKERKRIVVRNTKLEDFPSIARISQAVYPKSPPWRAEQLASHLKVFAEGQFVAVEAESQEVVGMAASLIIRWDDYDFGADWRDYTAYGMFTNHDPEHGRTLYGAEIMVHPKTQASGAGSKLYAARRKLVERLGLRRIRAAARLRGYHRFAAEMTAEEYAVRVIRGEVKDPTLSFQLKRGFEVLGVVGGYLHSDPESLGYAAVIEWMNPQVAKPEDHARRNHRFSTL